MSLKIVASNDPLRRLSFDGTVEAARKICRKIDGGGYENGVGGGNELLRDITTIDGHHVINIDGNVVAPIPSGGGAQDPRFNTILKIENDGHGPGPIPRPPILNMGLPERCPLGSAGDRSYLQQILESIRAKLDGNPPVPPSNVELQAFLLGVIMMSKCR